MCWSWPSSRPSLRSWSGWSSGFPPNVRANEHWPLEKLLYCTILKSANDASVVIAEGSAGSVENFAGLMNRKAAEIGARHTHFVNPHGLDAKSHYSTARDLALMLKYAGALPAFRQISGTRTASITSPTSRKIVLKNHNRLLGTYPGMLYGKSGYTSKARRCFVGQASRGGRELIVCVMGSKNHFKDAARLLDYGFQTARKPQPVQPQPAATSAESIQPSKPDSFVIQAAAFSDLGRAADLHSELTSRAYPAFIETVFLDNDRPWHRVKVGYYEERESAQVTRNRAYQRFQPVPSYPALAGGSAVNDGSSASTPAFISGVHHWEDLPFIHVREGYEASRIPAP